MTVAYPYGIPYVGHSLGYSLVQSNQRKLALHNQQRFYVDMDIHSLRPHPVCNRRIKAFSADLISMVSKTKMVGTINIVLFK